MVRIWKSNAFSKFISITFSKYGEISVLFILIGGYYVYKFEKSLF